MNRPPSPARQISVVTNYQVEALKPGGLPLAEALHRAEQNLAGLRDDFPRALEDEIAALSKIADDARTDEASWRNRLDLKCGDLSDAAATLGYALVAHIATLLRTACSDPAAQYPESIVAQHTQALRQYGRPEFRDVPLSKVGELLTSLAPPPREA
jgi:hypothetical protein